MPADLYDPSDPSQLRTQVYDQVLSAAKALPPRSNQRFTLSLIEPHYADAGEFTPVDERNALLSGQGLSRKLAGTWQLTDNATGQVLDKRKKTIARVPYVTPRGTIIEGGVDYVTVSQSRLKPGLYTRRQQNGEIETHANVSGGVGHRYFLDPAKGTFHVKLSQAKLPLLPLLRAFGATDSELREAWGDQILDANRRVNEQMAMGKYYDRLLANRGQPDPSQDRVQAVLAAFRKMQVDPEISRRNLGTPYASLDKDAILAITKRILAVSRGEAEPDSRDNLENRRFLHLPELMAERLTRDHGKFQRQLLRKAAAKGTLAAVPAGALTGQLRSLIIGSGLGQAAEEVNPLEILDKMTKVTSLGEGGLSGVDAIPAESREVNPSQYGFLDPVRTPENLRAGIDLYFTQGVRAHNGKLYSPFFNVRTQQVEYKTPEDLAGLTLSFPDQMSRKTKRVIGVRNGKLDIYPRADIDYTVADFEQAFSPLGNLIPGKGASKAHRMSMGSRMLTQALPLARGEAPLVQSADAAGNSFVEALGARAGAVRASQGGVVLLSGRDEIKVRYEDGREESIPLYDSLPLNRKTRYHQTTMVKPGERFQPGQLLARSNFTDDQGRIAMGVNARVGYMAYPGNYEDAIVISEDFARRTASQHTYQHTKEFTDEHRRGKAAFAGIFPSKYDRETFSQFDDDGVIKPGSKVTKDSPLILAVRYREPTRNQLHRGRQSNFVDDSEVWEHDSPGTVSHVYKGEDGNVTVVVDSEEISKEGDKFSGLFGDKGISAVVVPTHLMPRSEDGRPLEVLLNPLGLVSRVNATQIVEAVLGKVAEKTGKPYRLKGFDTTQDLSQYAWDELRKHGFKDTEDVYDPGSDRKIPGVLVGNRFIMKLVHTAESKLQAREAGEGYTSENQPAKGAGGHAKRLAMLASNAVLASGAYEVRRDASLIRGQRNEDFWSAFLQGLPLPTPQIPSIYEKLISSLKGAGINAVEDGPALHLLALTDKDVDTLAGDREIQNGETVRFDKGLEPVEGGLFDPRLTGGANSARWSYIKLDEPLPNPAFEDPIRRLLGLTKNRFEAVLAGREKLATGQTGPEGIRSALAALHIPREIETARKQIASGRKTYRDAAVRKLGYLKALQQQGLSPADWVLQKVPVLPTKFRPVSQLGDKKIPLIADANYLYRELIEARDNLRGMRDRVDDVGDERLAVYHAFKAVTGLGEPVHPKLQEKGVRGLLRQILGSSPKHSVMQRQLLGSTVDLVGRATIAPDPGYDMDTVGLPEDTAWSLYRMFVIRRLRRRGMSVHDAMRHVNDRTSTARAELMSEMDARPVITSRDPVLHKFGVIALRPRIVKGKTLKLSPLVTKGLGADFDGDAMNFQVPVSDEAVQEAYEKLMPSRNLLNPQDFSSPVFSPSQEFMGGLYTASAAESKRSRQYFADAKAALAAYHRGELQLDDRVKLLR